MALIDNDTTRAFLGPILEYLDDDDVTEILINAPDIIYIEKGGKLFHAENSFADQDSLLAAARNVAQFVGRRIDEKHPIMDARLPDGSRIHIVVPPAAKDGVYMAIRKFGSDPLQIKDLIQFGALSVEMARFLHICVQLKKNLIISGSTSSGKTTLLNAVSGFIPDDQRVVVIEDSSELQLQQEHVLRMETVHHDKLNIDVRELVKSSLRLRPDRIVIGEVRGPEALDLLQAMNTGHAGSMSTLHANNPKQAIARLETLIMMNKLEMPLIAIRSQVANAINIVVQAQRLKDGSRRLTHIAEVIGLNEDGSYAIEDVFVLEVLGYDEKADKLKTVFKPTGFQPTFIEEAQRGGIKVPLEMFDPKQKKSKK